MSQQSEPQQERFVIEATSHCRSGKHPRWTFLIKGVGSNARHGMLGTDEHGRGLFRHHTAARTQLVAPEELALPDTMSRQQANAKILSILQHLDWDASNTAATPNLPRFALYAVT